MDSVPTSSPGASQNRNPGDTTCAPPSKIALVDVKMQRLPALGRTTNESESQGQVYPGRSQVILETLAVVSNQYRVGLGHSFSVSEQTGTQKPIWLHASKSFALQIFLGTVGPSDRVTILPSREQGAFSRSQAEYRKTRSRRSAIRRQSQWVGSIRRGPQVVFQRWPWESRRCSEAEALK